jgi:hypothetical protein
MCGEKIDYADDGSLMVKEPGMLTNHKPRKIVCLAINRV